MVYILNISVRSCQTTGSALQAEAEDDQQKLTVSWLMRRSDSPSSRSGRASDTLICRFSVFVRPPLMALFTLNIADTSHILEKRKKKITHFSDHNGSLLRRQPGAIFWRDTPLLNIADTSCIPVYTSVCNCKRNPLAEHVRCHSLFGVPTLEGADART